MVQFCYLRLLIDNFSRSLLQWIARIKNGLKLRLTTRYRTYSNQISTKLIPIRCWKCRRRWLWSSLWQDIIHDHIGKISTRSWLVRLDLWGWCHVDGYTTYFKLLINCTGGGAHVNLYLDFSTAYPQKWLTWWGKKNSGYDGIIFGVGKSKLIANQISS